MVTVANVHDSKAAELLMRTLAYFLTPIKVILADGGYRGDIIEQVKNRFGYLINVVMRSDEKKTGFQPIPKDGLLNVHFHGLIMTEDYVEIMNL